MRDKRQHLFLDIAQDTPSAITCEFFEIKRRRFPRQPVCENATLATTRRVPWRYAAWLRSVCYVLSRSRRFSCVLCRVDWAGPLRRCSTVGARDFASTSRAPVASLYLSRRLFSFDEEASSKSALFEGVTSNSRLTSERTNAFFPMSLSFLRPRLLPTRQSTISVRTHAKTPKTDKPSSRPPPLPKTQETQEQDTKHSSGRFPRRRWLSWFQWKRSSHYDTQIFHLTAPTLLTLAADPLLSIVDTIYVGKLGSPELVMPSLCTVCKTGATLS